MQRSNFCSGLDGEAYVVEEQIIAEQGIELYSRYALFGQKRSAPFDDRNKILNGRCAGACGALSLLYGAVPIGRR